MNLKKTFLWWMAFLLCLTASAQLPVEQQQAIVLKRMIERNHYSPRAVDDSFSNDLYNHLLGSLDPAHLLLTAEETNQLAIYRNRLDDELQGREWNFLTLLTRLYGTAVRRTDSLVNALLQKPLDLTAADKLSFSTQQQQQFAPNVAAWKTGWTKYIKYRLLNAAYDLAQAQSPKKTLKETLATHDAALRQKLKRSLLQGMERFKNPATVAGALLETYLVSVSQCFDPHTMYLSPEQNDRFKTMLSKEDASYGFSIDEKDGKVVIQNLVPGGPAWRSGEVHRNDQLLQLSFDGKEPVDATLLDGDEVEALLDGAVTRTVAIKLRKGDGSTKTVLLRKEKIESEEARVKGYVLNGSRKIGYISLPDFYTSWEDGTGSSCAEDVAKEIINLKKEGIEGLIVDVRYNGGGSMQEAIEMIGIFINDGPVFAVKEKAKATYLKDPNRGTIWDGPLAVLINGQSASASESLAGSLQDLHRAVVVGSASFGKASMQQIFPMDTTAGNRRVNSPAGFVKITVGKLYRLNGNTAQRNGVQPDVKLPDAFEVVEVREQDLPNALPADAITGNAYYKPLAPLPTGELAAASAERVERSAAFADIKRNIQTIASFYKTKKFEVPLQVVAFENWRVQNDVMMTESNTVKSTPSAQFAVLNHQFEKQRLQTNAYAGEINNILLEGLQRDGYIEETYRIVADLIQKTTNK